MSLQELSTVPESVQRAAEAVAGLDRCFLVGFGRLGPEQTQALQSLERICAGTPLAEPVAAAIAAVGRNEFVDRHFAVLAAARASVQGAQYDALRAQAAAALGRPAPAPAADTTTAAKSETSGPVAVWQESTRNWLMELALAGFGQLEYQTLAPFTATLEHLQGEPRTARLAALLTGFLNELLGSLPISALPQVPLYRWVDLWTRGMIGSMRTPPAPAGRKVSGTLTILGVDLRQHGYFVSFDAYGLLQADGVARVVRVTQSSYKVDVLCGGEAWKCFPKETEPLLKAIGQQLTLKVDDMTLLPTGDLCWDGKAAAGKASGFLDLAAKSLAPGAAEPPVMPTVDPLDRHPIQLAEPVYLTGGTVKTGDAWDLELADGGRLPLAMNRLSGASEIKSEDVINSQALLGLLRFDAGRWAVQPLAVLTREKNAVPKYTGSRVLENRVPKKKGDVLAILQERASRLLRQKS